MAENSEGTSLGGRIRGFGPLARKTIKQIGPTRLVVTAAFLILGLLMAKFSWNVMLARDAERALYDVRALLAAPHTETDQRVVMVTFNEETLRLTGRRSPLDRSMLAKGLLALDQMNPKGIGIDILIEMHAALPDTDRQPNDMVRQAASFALSVSAFAWLIASVY